MNASPNFLQIPNYFIFCVAGEGHLYRAFSFFFFFLILFFKKRKSKNEAADRR